MGILTPLPLLLFAAALLLGSCATQEEAAGGRTAAGGPEDNAEGAFSPDTPLPVDPQVTIGRLENGLTYYIRTNVEPRNRAEMRLVVDAGSVLETEEQLGIAHYLEHMAFNGTENFEKQEIVDYLESTGMRFGPDLNAYTSFDETVYQLQLPTEDRETLDTGLQILREWAQSIVFTQEEVDRERGVIIEEWRLRRGADARIRDQQLPKLLYGSRYAERQPIGTLEAIRSFQPEDFRRFYDDWYRPELTGVVAVGDFDAAWVEERIRTWFSDMEVRPRAPDRASYEVPDHEQTLFAVAADPEATESRVSIITKHEVRPFDTVGEYRRVLVESLYHRMLNSRLDEIARKSDAPFLSAYSGEGRFVRTKNFYIMGARVREGEHARGMEALLTEARRVKEHGFTQSELDRARDEMLSYIERAYNERDKTGSASYVREYVGNYLEDEPIPGIEYEYELYLAILPTITLEDVADLAGRWLKDTSRVVMTSGPDSPAAAVPEPSDLKAVFELVERREVAPYVDRVSGGPLVEEIPSPASITRERRIEEIGVTEWTLSNGLRVVLKPTDFKNDEVLMTSYSPGGTSLVSRDDFVAAETAVAVVTEAGVGRFDRTELEKKLAGKTVEVTPWISELFEGMRGSSTPGDLETLFQLTHLYFTAPRKDRDAFAALKERERARLENRLASPEQVFWDAVRSAITQDHYRHRPWTPETLERMDLDASYRIYRDRFADAGDFTFFFVGNFDPERIEPLVRTYLGGLPSTGRSESWRDLGIEAPRGTVERTVEMGVEEKSRVQIVFTGPFDWTLENVTTINALSDLVDIRLRERIREEESGTYSIGSFASPSHYPDQEYRFFIGFGCAPDEAERLTDLVFEEISSLRRDGPEGGNVEKVKQILRRERETSLRRNDFWLGVLRSYYLHEQRPERILEYVEWVEDITPGSIREAARRYLDEDRWVKVVLYPEVWEGR